MPVIVNVGVPDATPRFPITVVSADSDSFELVNVKEIRSPVGRNEYSDLFVPVGVVVVVTLLKSSAGTDANDKHESNIVPTFVALDVSSVGMYCSAEQAPNIPLKFVPFPVFNAGTLCNEVHP